ncbi:MAG: DUF1491 family protein [Alphaproteobacteria bacterium]|nr:DUF1491 family protein [Alphaproteobacteria bacterium]MDE2335956.1 DUF1491 family protein [Alphaproteobacteria bacterium]
MTERLPTELLVAGYLRQCAARAIPVYIVHKGAPAAGTVTLRLALRDKSVKILNQSRDMDGNLGWNNPFDSETVDETRADAYIQKAVARDPDVWVIEVESADGRNPFEGKIF